MLGIVLVAGPYRKDEYFDGNHSYEFYCKQGHYPLEGVFRHISEEMKTEVLNAFFEEWNCYAYYPYRKLCVVEVPVSFSVSIFHISFAVLCLFIILRNPYIRFLRLL